jgi:elongation factor G
MREYGVKLSTGNPQVAYRETITAKAAFNYTHKKQTGGAGQFAQVAGYIEPSDGGRDYEFVDNSKGNTIPREFIPSCSKGFQNAMESGELIGFPVIGVRCVLEGGDSHSVDSSDIAFQLAARTALIRAFRKAEPQVLEPIMKVEVECPTEFQGGVLGNLNQRRGMITGTTERNQYVQINSEVPLSEMFGYATELRSLTQGKAEFTMEFIKYAQVPPSVYEDLTRRYGSKQYWDSGD